MAKHSLRGSERSELAGSKVLGQYDLKERVEVRLVLRRQNESDLQKRVRRLELGEDLPPLDRQTFANLYSTSPDDLAKVRRFASEYSLMLVEENPVASAVTLSGTVDQLQKTFEVKLELYEHPKGGQYRGRAGAIHIPDELQDVVTAVLGLDCRQQAHRSNGPSTVQPTKAANPPQGSSKDEPPALTFLPQEIGSLYNFPAGGGEGQCIGLIEIRGGYLESDLTGFFSGIGVKVPTIVPVRIKGGENPIASDPASADIEATLDIQIAGALAPEAKLVVYFAKNEDAHLANAVDYVIHDDINRPSVLSLSWGGSESNWTEQARQTLNRSLQVAAVLGITVCVASGDSGSNSGADGGPEDVNFPASSPYALACGGTQLIGSETSIESEVAWNDDPKSATGGGISRVFALPPWQEGLSAARTSGPSRVLSYRGVPDVAGNASAKSGYEILFAGQKTLASGTSAVAPLWAALIARINSKKNKSVGFIHPKLYRHPQVCDDVTQGNNGSFAAAPGWNACTGLGSPDGQKIFDLL